MRGLKTAIGETLSPRYMVLGLVFATVWMVLLAISDYPVDEWAGVVMLSYIVLWVAMSVIVTILKYALRWQLVYARSLRRQLKDEASDGERSGRGVDLVVTLVLASIMMTPVGLASALTVVVASRLGFPPLSSTLADAGLTMLGIGSALVAMYLVFSSAILMSASKRLERPPDDVPLIVNTAFINRRLREVPRYGGPVSQSIHQYGLGAPPEGIRLDVERLRELVGEQLPTVARAKV